MADESGAGTSLVERIKRILIEPGQEWDRIDAETMTVGGIFKSWVFPLAAIPALAYFVGMLIFGVSFLGVTYRPAIGSTLANAVVIYVFTTSGVFLYGLLIDALAPTFNGTQNRVQAQKVAAYSATPGLVAAILGLLPQLWILTLLGGLIYGAYLIYLGLPKLMKAPEDKTVPYIATVIVAGVVIVAVAWIIIQQVSLAFTPTVSSPYVIS